MELKKAVAELRSYWERCVLQQRLYGRDHNASIRVGSAIPIAETLLAALEGKSEPQRFRCPSCHKMIPFVHPFTTHKCDKPPDPPSHLAGRAVNGWGWKVFRLEDGGLRSQIIKDTKSEVAPLSERTWLHYRDWEAPQNKGHEAWHILKTEAGARAWITKRGYDEGHRVIRRVAWQGLANAAPSVWPWFFRGHIFTAEEIYILPEEGVPISPAETPELVKASRCSSCGGWIHPSAVICRKCRVAEIEGKPAERPPEKGDWILGDDGKPKKLKEQDFGVPAGTPHIDTGWCWRFPEHVRIVRRAADPLQEGDEVTFGSKEKEGEVTIVSEMAQTCRVKFDKTDVGWFNRKDLTLLKPVYDRPAEKGDC